MKPQIKFFQLLLLLLPVGLYSQIVIDQSDMPIAGDTLRVSLTSIIPVNFSQTGRDTTWDFSMLEALNQRVDTFVTANNTPPEYWLFFLPGIVSNLASPQGNSEFIPGFPVSQSYVFYKNSSDAFVDNGFAFKVQGIPLPAKYNLPDKYYSFPLDTNASWASSSFVDFAFPGMFYFSTSRIRTSFVDGWGTVITRFGSFQSLRVRSDLQQHDSIYIDSLSFGVGITRNITEYKWLAKTMGIPVLQINSEGLLSTATYLDSTRLSTLPLSVSLGPDTTVNKGATITMHASVTGGAPPYRFFWSSLDTSQSLTVSIDSTQSFGVVVIDGLNKFASDQKLVTVVSPGIEEQKALPLRIFPNPTDGLIQISLPDNVGSGELQLFDWNGKKILSRDVTDQWEYLHVDLSPFSEGIYMFRLITEHKQYQGKVVLK